MGISYHATAKPLYVDGGSGGVKDVNIFANRRKPDPSAVDVARQVDNRPFDAVFAGVDVAGACGGDKLGAVVDNADKVGYVVYRRVSDIFPPGYRANALVGYEDDD